VQCLGQNYAYHEASYFLVRLLQQFDTFTLASDVQPRESLPLLEWKIPGTKGRSAVERVWPGAAMTLYVKVSVYQRILHSGADPRYSRVDFGSDLGDQSLLDAQII
jgi:hypothetical protein